MWESKGDQSLRSLLDIRSGAVWEDDHFEAWYTKKGRDLDRFRCELKAYQNLHDFGVCDRGFVPSFYGYVDRLDPSAFGPLLRNFSKDKFRPRAILLEYLPDAERLNCVNYSRDLVRSAVQGLQEVHNAFVHHRDIYPKNMLVSGGRIIWVDFDVATTFANNGPREMAYCDYEIELVKSFGELLDEDQREGLPPNTKYY
ncbi:hypothetical protein N7492_008450 [Penicillium capsulatum]|uniref:Protein kinase domain-containing protein n=1 Tax=Penicillium capsulatum TaxID=69766 RepID=A0A9W9HRY9_9EURO|nr:hypothetical protein N7492_008450 [Penicillium capsulatum]